MLTAIDGRGRRVTTWRREQVEAADYSCSVCGHAVSFREYRTRPSCFVHDTDAPCPASRHNTNSVVSAKAALADRTADRGLRLRLVWSFHGFTLERMVELGTAPVDFDVAPRQARGLALDLAFYLREREDSLPDAGFLVGWPDSPFAPVGDGALGRAPPSGLRALADSGMLVGLIPLEQAESSHDPIELSNRYLPPDDRAGTAAEGSAPPPAPAQVHFWAPAAGVPGLLEPVGRDDLLTRVNAACFKRYFETATGEYRWSKRPTHLQSLKRLRSWYDGLGRSFLLALERSEGRRFSMWELYAVAESMPLAPFVPPDLGRPGEILADRLHHMVHELHRETTGRRPPREGRQVTLASFAGQRGGSA